MEVLVDLLEVLDGIGLLLYPGDGHVGNCSPSLFLRNSWKIIWRWDEVGVFPSKNDLSKEKDSGLFIRGLVVHYVEKGDLASIRSLLCLRANQVWVLGED